MTARLPKGIISIAIFLSLAIAQAKIFLMDNGWSNRHETTAWENTDWLNLFLFAGILLSTGSRA
jgi:hypothetical protein